MWNPCPPWRINSRHYELEKCRLREARRIRRETLQNCFELGQISIWINAEPLEPADEFIHLVCTISYNNSNWTAMYQNRQKARQLWRMISNVLMKIVWTVRACGILYKLVAQTLILYESNIWMVMGAIMKVLEGFHHWVAQKIAGMTDRCTEDGECE